LANQTLLFPVTCLQALWAEEVEPVCGNRERNSLIFDDVTRLMDIIRQHHPETFQHSLNVASLSVAMAKGMGLSGEEVRDVAIGGLLHDLGKTAVPSSILCKPAKLTEGEWQQIRQHPIRGMQMLEPFGWAADVLPMVLYHHERVDGRGYHGLTEGEIPLSARIICIADAFDAMAFTRPYQAARPLGQCWEELERNRGAQFDVDLVSLFIPITADICAVNAFCTG